MRSDKIFNVLVAFGIVALAWSLNLGTLRGQGGADGNAGIFRSSAGDLTDLELNIKTPVTGENGGDGGSGFVGGNGGTGGAGIFFSAGRDIGRVELEIFAPVTGGNGGTGGFGVFGGNGGNGGAGIFLDAGRDIFGVELETGGPITGGDGGQGGGGLSANGSGGNGGAGIFLNAGRDIFGVELDNSAPITGGKGGSGFNGGDGGAGVLLNASNTISGVEVENSSTIIGGNSGDGSTFSLLNVNGPVVPGAFVFTPPFSGQGGNGVSIFADGDVSDIELENFGTIRGGNAGNVDGGGVSSGGGSEDAIGAVAGEGGNGVLIESLNGNVTDVELVNTGIDTIAGGNGGSVTAGEDSSEGGNGGSGVLIEAGGDINNVAIKNKGTITGGNGGNNTDGGDDSIAGNGGHGVSFSTESTISNIDLRNRGTIIGGNGGEITSDDDDPKAGNGGDGVSFSSANENTSNGSMRNITLINGRGGSIIGGEGGGADSFSSEGDSDDPHGGNGGHGISFTAGVPNEDTEGGGTTEIANVTLINKGTITGGDGGGATNAFDDTDDTDDPGSLGGNGGDGVRFLVFSETGTIHDINLINCGTITGGNGGHAEGDDLNAGGFGGTGILFSAHGALTNITVTNYGSITGGEGGDSSGSYFDEDGNEIRFGDGGDGIFFNMASGPEQDISGNGSNLVVNNFGTIKGGDAGDLVDSSDPGQAGIGIHTNVGNLTVNNWGNIIGGGDAPDFVDGPPTPTPALAPAVLFTGAGNRINLYGFSVINGTISADGSPNDSNVLNFAFSGVNKAGAAELHAILDSSITGSDTSGWFYFRGELYQWQDIIIELNPTSYQQQGITPNQKSIGKNLDGFTSTPSDDMRNLLAAVDISGNVPWALDQLSPQRYQLYSEIAFAHANFNTLEIDQRLNNLRDGSESIDARGLCIASDIQRRAGFGKDVLPAIRQDPSKDGPHISGDPSKDGKTVLPSEPEPEKQKRWGTFISGNIVAADVDGHGGDLEDANFTTAGLMAGLDARISRNFVAGLLFSYGHSDADLDPRGSNVKVDTYTGGVYAGFERGPWYANALATYSANDYDSRRVVLPFLDCPPMEDRVARANTSGNQFAVNLDGGYDFHPSKCVILAPTVGLQYVNLNVDGFDETEAGAANLAVRSQDADSLRSRLGGRMTVHKAVNRCVFVALEARAAWQHEFLDDSRDITAEFIGAGLGPFAVRSTEPQRDAALLGAGINTTFRGTYTVFLDYDAQVGQSDYLMQGGRGGLRVSF